MKAYILKEVMHIFGLAEGKSLGVLMNFNTQKIVYVTKIPYWKGLLNMMEEAVNGMLRGASEKNIIHIIKHIKASVSPTVEKE
jgi:hypothetical protein